MVGTGRGRERDLRSDPSQRAMRADGCRPACEPTRRVTLRARAAPAPAVKRQPGPAAAAAPAVHTLLDPPADGLCSCVSLSLSLPPRLLLRSPSSCMFYPSLFRSPPILLLFSPPPPINQPCCRRSLRTPAGAASVWARPKGILAGPVPPTESRLRSTPSASPSRGLLCRPDPRESRPSRRCACLLLRRLLPACEHSCVRATTGALLPPQWRRAIRAALSSHTRRGCRTSAGQSAGDLIQQSRNATRPPQSPPPSPQPSPPHSRDLSAVAGAPPRRIPSRRPLGDSRRGARRPAVAWRCAAAQAAPSASADAGAPSAPSSPPPLAVSHTACPAARGVVRAPAESPSSDAEQQRDSGSLRSFVA